MAPLSSQVALDYAQRHKVNLSLVEYPINRGKGGAVRAVRTGL